MKHLGEFRCVETDDVPDGFYTALQIAEAMGVSDSQARIAVNKAIKAGRAEMRSFRIRSGSRVYPVPHYRMIG